MSSHPYQGSGEALDGPSDAGEGDQGGGGDDDPAAVLILVLDPEGGRDGEVDDAHELIEAYDASMRDALKLYHHMIERGVARELARAVLPQSMMTTFWMSGTLRNWAHFIRLRADAHAQPEAIELAVAIREILRDAFPRSVAALIGGVDE